MITPPQDWSRSVAPQVLVLRPPRGGGRVRCYLQLPAATFRVTLEHVLAADPGFVVAAGSPPRPMLTEEGEYGGWTELSGTHAGQAARRWVAAILLDTFVVAIDGLSLDESADQEISGCTLSAFTTATFGLGMRRRRYLFQRPPGWRALATGLVATFYPPDYPRHRSQLVVYPAEPLPASPAEVFTNLLEDEERRGFEKSAIVTAETFPWQQFTGHHYSYAGKWPSDRLHVKREAAVLSDGRHYYVMRLENAAPERLVEGRAVLRALATSVEPVPYPGERRPIDVRQLTELSGPWAE